MLKIYEINDLEYKINCLRLEVIKIIAELNKLLKTDSDSFIPHEYAILKSNYLRKKTEINRLREKKRRLENA